MFSFKKIIFHAEVIGMFHYSYVHSNTQAVGPCSMQISSLDLHMSQPESRLVSSRLLRGRRQIAGVLSNGLMVIKLERRREGGRRRIRDAGK